MQLYNTIIERYFGAASTTEKGLANRLNMGHLFVFSIFSSGFVAVTTALFALFKFYILPADYQTMAFSLFAVCLILSALTIAITSRLDRRDLFGPVCLCFLAMVTVLLFNFAFRSVSNVVAVIFFWLALMIQAIVPRIHPKTFSIIMGLDLIPTIILIVTKKFSAESIISVICIFIMCFFMSVISYTSWLSSLDYKSHLDNAVSQAETDPMTLLLNRRGLDRRVADVWPHCIRQNACVAVLMIDIDNFKKYNDTFGHAAGDDCIRAVTGAIRDTIRRRTDYGARVGGEEFLVFLTGIEPQQAVKWSLELKHAVDNLKIPHAKTNFKPYVSISMGLACSLVTDDTTFDKLREEADKSLYDAKHNGRDRLYYRHKSYGIKVS